MAKSLHPAKHTGFCKSLACKFLLSCLLLLRVADASAQGDLLITPLRVVFEGQKKMQEISLANVGKDTATFAVSVKNYRMADDGSFTEIDSPDAGQRFAAPYLRIFPRKVTLAPNESQVVKLQVTHSSEMATGEYRSHIYFRAVPDENPLADTTKKKSDSSGLSISLKPIFGITIPVIIRVGENDADVTLSDVFFAMSNDKPTIYVTFNRTGNMSVYGDMTVDYISPSGESKQVKLVKGIAVYTPGTIRRFSVELDNDDNFDFHKGSLHVAYKLLSNDKTVKTVEANVALK